MNNAVLSAHVNTSLVTRAELASVPVPAPTKTWHPIAHDLVPTIIEKFVTDYGWQFKDEGSGRFKLALSPDGNRMFGVTEIVIPHTENEDYGLALGFRNSHNKTMALRLALGSHVFVCDNLALVGDVQFRRIHYATIDPIEVVRDAFNQIPAAAESMGKWFKHLQGIKLSQEDGVYLIAEAVEAHALPLTGFMRARAAFLAAYKDGSETVRYGGTVWAAYQSITEQYKRVHFDQNPVYSANLTKLMTARFDGKLLPAGNTDNVQP